MNTEEKVLTLLLDGIEALSPSREMQVRFVREAIKRFCLSIEDCFPETDVLSLLSEVRNSCERLRESLMGAITETEKPKVPVKESPLIAVRQKGYSRNGKKLGRPRKKKVPENCETVQIGDAIEIQKCTEGTVSNPKTNIESSETSTRSPTIKLRQLTASEQQELESLKMGKEYSTDILYVWRNTFIVSNRVLQEASPLGVFVPYQRKGFRYSKFVLYLSDEIKGLPVKKAVSYARNRLPAYQEEKWDLLDRWQIESIKRAQPELNQILHKIGGDKFTGNYLIKDETDGKNLNNKIRYAVNVV